MVLGVMCSNLYPLCVAKSSLIYWFYNDNDLCIYIRYSISVFIYFIKYCTYLSYNIHIMRHCKIAI